MCKATQLPFSLKEFNSLVCGLHNFSCRDRLLKIFVPDMSLSWSMGLSFVIISSLVFILMQIWPLSGDTFELYVYFELKVILV